ncbi:MAG: SpoIIIAH-like family protein [Clostridia bacterium]|nr:SpoIIIAH-like family protein [Clostridia bacterium]
MFLKRKSAVTAMIVLFICVAVYLNWSFTQGVGIEDSVDVDSGKILGEATLIDNEEKIEETKDDYFENARLEKQKARDSAISTLKETTMNDKVTTQERESATKGIENLANGAVVETQIETLVKAKGFTDCVTLINEAGVNVIVKVTDAGLSEADASKIKDIVVSEAKVKPSQIKIIEIK